MAVTSQAIGAYFLAHGILGKIAQILLKGGIGTHKFKIQQQGSDKRDSYQDQYKPCE